MLHPYSISAPTVTDLIGRWLDGFPHTGLGPPDMDALSTCVGNVAIAPSGNQKMTITGTSSQERTRHLACQRGAFCATLQVLETMTAVLAAWIESGLSATAASRDCPRCAGCGACPGHC